jgi:hypothetical protein
MGNPAGLTWREMKGRNGWEPPSEVPDDMGTEAVNVVLLDGSLPKRRPGAELIVTTGDAWTDIGALEKYVPSTGLAYAHALLVSLSDTPPKIVSLDTSFVGTNLTLTDNITDHPEAVSSAQLNGKLFLAYHSGKNRLHVWDFANAPTLVTRSGLAPPVAPTGANTGAGTYASTPRWYAVSARDKAGAIVLAQSERGPGLAFTPSGTGTAVRVTKPVTVETQTHWVVWGSSVGINGPYYQLAEIAVGTTTYDDAAAPFAYNLGTLEPTAGEYLCFPSVKFLLSDGTRLYGVGVWETTDMDGNSLAPLPGRVYFGPVVNSSGHGDDERIESTVATEGWIDLTPGGAGAEDRGLGGPINGEIFAFQSKGIFRLIPTGQATNPIARVPFSPHVGALSHKSIVLAEDETGAPAIYFLNPEDGPRRITADGRMQWLGRDVNDLWQRVNQNAATVKAWGVFDPTNKRVLWYVAVDGASTPTLILTFDVTHGELQTGNVVRKGWAQWTGNAASWIAGLLFPSNGNVESITGGGGPHGTLGPSGSTGSLLARINGTRHHDYGTVSVPAGPTTYNQQTGTYSGTGLAQTITLGFQAQAILIMPMGLAAATTQTGAIWTTEMGTLAMNPIAQAHLPLPNLITNVSATGFTLGTDPAVSTNGQAYSYIAFADSIGDTFVTGSYIGDDTDNRNIVIATGFQPTVLYVFGMIGAVKDDQMPGGNYSVQLGGAWTTLAGIKALQANGFQVGTRVTSDFSLNDSVINGDVQTYYYIAWKHDGGGLLAQVLKRNHYTGTGAPVAVTVGFGVVPQFVSIVASVAFSATYKFPAWKQAANGGANAVEWAALKNQTTAITSLDSNGFTVGLGLSKLATEYYWHAFASGSSIGIADNP